MKRLGIDLGTSSLGWAIIDDDKLEKNIINTEKVDGIEAGVIIFPEGMDREKSGKLISPAAERRQKRATRRLIARRKLRKFHILKLLIAEGMCPMAPESLELWQKKKIYPVDDKPFMEWLAATKESNPYLDRKLAAEVPVDKYMLGRAIYHLAQRRGFKSSRKEQLQEILADENSTDKKVKSQDELGVVKQAIADLTQRVGNLTLGQYFYTLFEKDVKIRGQKTGRIEHYEKEFAQIAKIQKLDPALEQKIHDILFFQRPLRIQRHLVGWCELEKKKKYRRCLESHPLYEKYCVLSFLNNIKVIVNDNEKRTLTDEEYAKLYKYLHRVSAPKMADIRKQLGKNIKLNYRDDVTIPYLEVTTRFSNLNIPEDKWQTALNALVDFQDLTLLQAWAEKTFQLTPEAARKFACINPSTERASYSLHAIKKILPFLEKRFLLHKALFCANLPSIIPNYDATKEAEILEAFNRYEEAYQIDKERVESSKHYTRVIPIKERWKNYLISTWNITEEDYKKLYVDTRETDPTKTVLPPVKMGAMRNPLVLRALTVLRRLVNTLRKEGKIDAYTRINIELAHAVNSSNMCAAIEAYQKELAKERDTQRSNLEAILARLSKETGRTLAVNEDLLLRHILWEEQGRASLYTGQPISESEMVFNCDIEHTIPRSRGGTNERINLTLCESHYNRNIKKGLLPTECPNAEAPYNDPQTGKQYPALEQSIVIKKWRTLLEQLEKECAKKKPKRGGDINAYNQARQKYLMLDMKRTYWKRKLRTFSLRADAVDKENFMPRQLVDTGSITSHAVDYLKQLYASTYCVNGSATAFARKAWGIQAQDKAKSRIDHTHHAVDAMVIAAIDHARFNAICSALKNNDHLSDDELVHVCPQPYEKFGERIHCTQENILVRQLVKNRTIQPVTKTAVRKKITLATPIKRADGTVIREVASRGSSVRGSLHDDTLYGRINHNGEECTVIRKPLSVQSLADLNKLVNNAVDNAIREALQQQIQAYIDEYEAQGYTNPKDYEKALCLRPFYAPHKPENKNPPQIKSIRILAQAKNPDKLRKHAFESHNAAHNFVYKNGGDLLRLDVHRNTKGKLIMTPVGLLDEALQMKNNTPQLPPENTIASGRVVIIHKDDETIHDLKALSQKALSKRLYYIRKVQGDGRITLWYHREARQATILEKELALLGKNKKGESKLSFTQEADRLFLLSPNSYINNLLLEGKDFNLTLDGHVEWLK